MYNRDLETYTMGTFEDVLNRGWEGKPTTVQRAVHVLMLLSSQGLIDSKELLSIWISRN
jgi:hypothetical protein